MTKSHPHPAPLRRLLTSGGFMVLCIVIATVARFWNLEGTLQFLGDQGRDALVVSKIFKERDLVFIGPVTSVGNMYLGPLYYYFMLPFLWMSYPSPMGPVYAVAVLGITAVWLTYRLGRELVGERAALIGAGLLSINAVAVTYSRFSWNPNPAPFVSIIMVWCVYQAWRKNVWYWVGAAVCFAVLMQLHYLTLLSAGGAGVIGLWQLITLVKSTSKEKNKQLRAWVSALLVGGALVALSTTPLMLFDYKHGWTNAQAFASLLTREDNFTASESVSFSQKVAQTVRESHGRSILILFEIMIGQHLHFNSFLLIVFALGAPVLIVREYHLEKSGKPNHYHGMIVLGAFILTGIVGTSTYQHSIFHHYLAYLYPISALVWGVVLDKLIGLPHHTHVHAMMSPATLGKIITACVLIGYVGSNLQRLPLRQTGWTVRDMQRTSTIFYEHLKPGEKYNLVMMSETGDIEAQNYRYFLSATDRPPVKTEERGSVETLLIINEDRKLSKVTDSPIYEIVTFPDKMPKEVFEIPGGPEITILSTRADRSTTE